MAISPTGRWGGRLTSRPLPTDDPGIARLDAADRAQLAAVWHARAATERRVATSFEVIRDALAALGADAALVALADRAVDDEHRHAELCRVVASCFHGADLAPPDLLPHSYPKHPGASDALRPLLHVIGQCCMNETFASAYLETAFAAATGALARAALRELLSDEIDHAKLGWACVAAVPPGLRAEAAPWLLRLARANLRMWRDAPRDYPSSERLAAHGAPRPEAIEAALLAALGDLIVPGLAHVGLPTDDVAAWLAAGAPTG